VGVQGRAAVARGISAEPQGLLPVQHKYDAWLRGKVELTGQEKRGLASFNDPKKGNCASGHPSQIRGGAFPTFSDFGFDALAVTRNRNIPANRDPHYYDLSLCGPLRESLKGHKKYCGAFRAPSLRNVTLRRSFFHNGMFHSLEQVLQFYVQRDLSPEKWYPHAASGRVLLYDDLPRGTEPTSIAIRPSIANAVMAPRSRRRKLRKSLRF
jgi:cytochrome c peroxidase